VADPFDTFEVDTKDGVRWLGAAATLADAQATILRCGADAWAKYVVINQKTGNKVTMDHAGLESPSRPAGAGQDSEEPSLGRAANG